MKDKVAILGAGASGFGTYLGLIKNGYTNIDVYNSSNRNNIRYSKLNNIENLDKKIKNLYSILKSLKNYGILNRKSYLGAYLDEIKINKKSLIYNNNIEYGLTNFWGGILQDFDDEYLSNNKVLNKSNNLTDKYRELSLTIPITNPGLNNKFINSISNNIAIKVSNLNSKFNDYLNQKNEINHFISPVSLETSDNKNFKECLCIIGACPIHSIFSTEKYFKSQKIKVINQEIERINFKTNEIIFLDEKKKYDKIYINLGPYNSQKLIIKSMGLEENENILIKDGTSYVFPIYFTGKINFENTKNFFNLTNNIINFKNQNDKTLTLQIYPSTDHIIRSILPKFLFNMSSSISNLFLKRILWVKCYLPYGVETEKTFSLTGKDFFEKKDINKIEQNKKFIFEKISQVLKKSDFFPINITMNGKTSSHYSGCNQNILKMFDASSSKISNNIILSDSTLWNSVPSQSPTFTIMANAMDISTKNE